MDRKKERGHVAVEAVIILPIAVLSTLLLLYLALFLFSVQVFKQHWRLHSSIIKTQSQTTYVTKNSEMEYTEGDRLQVGAGNSYSASQPSFSL